MIALLCGVYGYSPGQIRNMPARDVLSLARSLTFVARWKASFSALAYHCPERLSEGSGTERTSSRSSEKNREEEYSAARKFLAGALRG